MIMIIVPFPVGQDRTILTAGLKPPNRQEIIFGFEFSIPLRFVAISGAWTVYVTPFGSVSKWGIRPKRQFLMGNTAINHLMELGFLLFFMTALNTISDMVGSMMDHPTCCSLPKHTDPGVFFNILFLSRNREVMLQQVQDLRLADAVHLSGGHSIIWPLLLSSAW